MEVLKVAASTETRRLAGAIAEDVKKHGSASLQAIGAAAVNQAVKAVITARGFLAPLGVDVVIVPAFGQAEVNGEPRTVIVMEVRVI